MGLILQYDMPYLPKAIILSPLYEFVFFRQQSLFVCHDFQVDTLDEECSTIAIVESTNVYQKLNIILDLNVIPYSCVQKSTMTRWGIQQRSFYLRRSCPFCHHANSHSTKGNLCSSKLEPFLSKIE